MTDPHPDDFEAVAKAIYLDRNGHGCRPWSCIEAAHKVPYRAYARAAILAYEASKRERETDLNYNTPRGG